MKWISVKDQPPLDCRIECLVCTKNGHLHMAEYHSDPEGWWPTNGCGKIYDVIAYIYETDIDRPRPKPYITNDEWISLVFLKDKK